MAPATILSYLLAIGFVHKMRGFHNPAKAFIIQKLLTSLSRRKLCDERLPISKPILHDLINSLQHTNSSAAQHILFSAMFLTAFYGFFRIGELAAKSLCSTVVQYENLRLLSSGGKIHSTKITIRNFKHTTTNRSFDIVITGDDCSPYCPVAFLLQYCKIRGDQPGPLFCQSDNQPISVNQFYSELRCCLAFCGLDPRHYKSHSFRIGAACLAAEKGFLMHRFTPLANGNLMLLSFTLGILPCQLFNFDNTSLGQSRAAKHSYLLQGSRCLLLSSNSLCI